MQEIPRRTSLAHLASPCFLLCFIGVETEGISDYQEDGGDDFHCTVEPSPDHIQRLGPSQKRFHHLLHRNTLRELVGTMNSP